MNRGTLKIEASHTNEIRVSLTLSDDGTVWMTVEEIAHTFGVLAASVQREIRKILASEEFLDNEVRREQSRTLSDGRVCITEYYNLDMLVCPMFLAEKFPVHDIPKMAPKESRPVDESEIARTAYPANND